MLRVISSARKKRATFGRDLRGDEFLRYLNSRIPGRAIASDGIQLGVSLGDTLIKYNPSNNLPKLRPLNSFHAKLKNSSRRSTASFVHAKLFY